MRFRCCCPGLLVVMLCGPLAYAYAAPLHDAVRQGDIAAIWQLVNRKVNLNAPDEDGAMPIHLAVEQRDVTVARMLLAHGARVNTRNGDGMTPLLLATMQNNMTLVQMLLAYKADPNVPDASQRTPLSWAVKQKNAALVALLETYRVPSQSTAPLATVTTPPPARPTPTVTASTTPPAPLPPPITSPQARFLVQLASMSSEYKAKQVWQLQQQAFPALLGHHALHLERVYRDAYGTLYRVQTGPFVQRAEAEELCTRLQARQQECLVLQR